MSAPEIKILIIDDSETVRISMKNILLREEYKVVEACDGQDALEKVQENNDLNLIICDVNMPNMDGVTFCEHLRKISSYDKVPVMMVTTESVPSLILKAKELGVKAWILKPFNANKVLLAIRKLLGLKKWQTS
jgi:two-component system, chemotaxis family, chemotaxis protein CheY